MKIKFSCALVLYIIAQGATYAIGYNSNSTSGGGATELDTEDAFVSEFINDSDSESDVGVYLDSWIITSDSIGENKTVPPDNFGEFVWDDPNHYMIGPEGYEGEITFESLTILTGRQLIVNCIAKISKKLTISNDLIISGSGSIVVDTLVISDNVLVTGLSSITANYIYISNNTLLSTSTTINVAKDAYAFGSALASLESTVSVSAGIWDQDGLLDVFGTCYFEKSSNITISGSLSASSIYLADAVDLTTSGSIVTSALDVSGDVSICTDTFTLSENGAMFQEGILEIEGTYCLGNSTVSNILGELTISNLNLDASASMSIESLTMSSSGSLYVAGILTAANLHLNDGVRMTVDPSALCSVTSDVYILGDVFVNTPYDFGNTSTHVDFKFTGDAFRYFTPPFDIAASAFGTVETDLSADGEANSVWIYAYDEANEAINPSANAWTLIDSETTLLAGKGYSIWASVEQVPDSVVVTLSSDISYPNIADSISNNIQYTEVNNNFESNGMNALGNPFSLPLALTGERESVKSYFYFNGRKYITMSNGTKVGDDLGTEQDPLVIPSYSSFYAFVESEESLGFSLDDLTSSSSLVRLKSTIQADLEYIRLMVKTETDYDDAVLRFVDGGALGVDSYDVTKMFVSTSDVEIQISTSTTSGSGNYAIQSLPAIDDLEDSEIFNVPFKFTTSQVGVFYISAKLINLTSDQVTPYLYDNETGELTELTEDSLSLTITSSYDRSGRYNIKGFSAIPTHNDDVTFSEPTSIHTSDNVLYIETSTGSTGIIKILDTSGKLVDQRDFNSSCSISLSTIPKGVYVVHVSFEDQLSTVKKIIVQ